VKGGGSFRIIIIKRSFIEIGNKYISKPKRESAVTAQVCKAVNQFQANNKKATKDNLMIYCIIFWFFIRTGYKVD